MPADETTGDSQAHHPASVFTASIRRRDLVAAYPDLNPACDEMGFGWHAPLKENVERPEHGLLELARAAHPPYVAFSRDWRRESMADLIQDIVAHHHMPLRNELRRLEILMARALHHAPALGRTALPGQFTDFVKRQLAHLDQEEYVAFPLCTAQLQRKHPMAEHDRQQFKVAIGEMSNGHVDTEAFLYSLISQIHAVIANAPHDIALVGTGLAAMQEDLSVHQMKEDGILLPAMTALAG